MNRKSEWYCDLGRITSRINSTVVRLLLFMITWFHLEIITYPTIMIVIHFYSLIVPIEIEWSPLDRL